jgi:serine/threonine-protein kinase HipA
VQAKLPVSLFDDGAGPAIRIGDLRHACTHILKVPSGDHPGLVENEWATMELARRIGLPVSAVAMVELPPESAYRKRSLLVERYDIPARTLLERGGTDLQLPLQEDACSLLLLRREDKHSASLERIAEALLDAGVDPAGMRGGMRDFLQLVLFSWIVGNGDLHAKNVSVLRRFRAGLPGEPPVLEGVELAPFYDLVNTRLHIPNDEFALPVSGRRANIRLKHFEALASRWGMAREEVRWEVQSIATGVGAHLEQVLAESPLAAELQVRYREIVADNLGTLRGGA